jgi:hypothetical protein
METNHQHNPLITLTEAQTNELRSLWGKIRRSIDIQKSNLIWLKLSRNEARLSRRQLFMAASILADKELSVPDWCHVLLDISI